MSETVTGPCLMCGDETDSTAEEKVTGHGITVHACPRCQEKAERNSRYGRTGWEDRTTLDTMRVEKSKEYNHD